MPKTNAVNRGTGLYRYGGCHFDPIQHEAGFTVLHAWMLEQRVHDENVVRTHII
jgi:hypothetical protein